MTIARRIFLFLAVNFLVITMLSIVMAVFGIGDYLTPYGLNYQSLLAFCLIWGMGGAFISLWLSRAITKWTMRIQLIDSSTRDPGLRDLLDTVRDLCRKAGITTMPEVGIYESDELNAFATGPTKSRALVAVSSGLLSRMNKAEIEGVLGHEISHIANGDMVTMTLIQGVVNAFVMFAARVVAFAIQSALFRGEGRRSGGLVYFIIVFVLQTVFMILGAIVVAWFSRWREYRADAGSARLGGRDSMIQALTALERNFDQLQPATQPAIETLKISTRPSRFFKLWSSHPPLAERIARLKAGNF